jgi:hypothetical protein
MNNTNADKKRSLYYRDMTVADIRRKHGADFVEVVFLESARFYRLLKQNKAYADILKELENAMLNARPVKVGLESVETDVIEEVKGVFEN